MKFGLLVGSLAVIAASGPAQAFTHFSLAGAPDPGLGAFETSLVTFDAPSAAGVTETDLGTVGLFTGTYANAAKPALDETTYIGLGTGGSATFDFSGYFTGKHIHSISVYVGSVDAYNHIDVLAGTTTLGTIGGADFPADNGDQDLAITNRRLFINFADNEGVTGLRFRSDGIAFEFDTIAASGVKYETPTTNTPDSLPKVIDGTASVVPEPAAWLLMVAGFGLVGAASRRRHPSVVAA